MSKKLLLILLVTLVFASIIAFRLMTKTDQNRVIAQPTDTRNMHHLTMKIEGMYCASCPYNVEQALKDTPGVVNVTIGFIGKEIINGAAEGRGEIVYDATKTKSDKLIQAILPYKGSVLSDEPTSVTTLAPLSKTFGR